MAKVAAGTYEVDPISRIEGHLGVKVTVNADGRISEANAHGNLWRGFENFLIGRQVNDAITFTQRICGVCPLPHATASTFAVDSVTGVSDGYITFDNSSGKGVPPRAVLIRNLVYACEFLMSNITHFYHLAAPSYIQGPAIPPWTPFYNENQYNENLRNQTAARALPEHTGGTPNNLWSAVIKQYVKALRIRRLTFDAGAMFAGRMPMVASFVAGGVTNEFRSAAELDAKCDAFETIMKEVGEFVIKEYIPLALALGALYPEYDSNGARTATNEAVGTGNGTNAVFQLDHFPVDSSATITVNVNGVATTAYTLDESTGVITFDTAPANALAVTASYKWLAYGAGCGNFLSWGAFPSTGAAGMLDIKGGFKMAGDATPTIKISGRANVADAKAWVEDQLLEFIGRSRYDAGYGYASADGSAYPGAVTRTVPKRDSEEKYSWLKAPRLGTEPMEVGPLARLVVNSRYLVNGGRLVDQNSAVPAVAAYGNLYLDATNAALDTRAVHADLVAGLNTSANPGGNLLGAVQNFIVNLTGGLSTMDRLRARAIEAFWLITWTIGSWDKATGLWNHAGSWIEQLRALGYDADSYVAAVPGSTSGYGVSEAPRGALAHFVTSSAGKITAYQCVVPTTWNASPKDGADAGLADGTTKRGPMETACLGVPFESTAVGSSPIAGYPSALSGVEVLRIAQSFDPCIACAVH